jgi:hypothetical protein
MKTILLAISIFFVTFINSQTLNIGVSKVSDVIAIDSNLFNVINNSELPEFERDVNGFYSIDLTEKTFKYFYKGKVETEGDIVFGVSNGVYIVSFLIDGYDLGLVVNTDIMNEQVTWFSILGDTIQICKFKDFEIMKGS